jgi:hypothetical protein
MHRRLLIGVSLAALAVVVLVAVVRYDGPLIRAFPLRVWSQSHKLKSVNAEVFYVTAPHHIVRRGSSRIIVVRLKGPADLVPYHFQVEGLSLPKPIEEWRDYLEAPIVFNAGQFDEKMQHLGWLKAHGAWISQKRKPAWKGLLVSGPTDGGLWARIIDLQTTDYSVVARYRHAVQSMMLIDDAAVVRVRDTELAACRTVVAQDHAGRLLILVSEGAVTLADLARWLTHSDLGVVRAMNLDGGIESQLAIHTPELLLAMYGQYGSGATMFESGSVGMIRYPLPMMQPS